MPIWFAAVPWILGAARVAIPIATRAIAGGASTVGRGAATVIRYRKPLSKAAAPIIQGQILTGDLPDLTKTGLVQYGIFQGIDGIIGWSKSSGSTNRKAGSGRPKSSGVGIVDPRQGGYRPNNRPGGYMPRF